MKRIALFFLIASLGMVSCSKKFDPIEDNGGKNATSINNADVKAGFDWKTSKSVSVLISGLDNQVLELRSTLGGSYIKALVKGENKFEANITIPAKESEIILVYDGQKEILSIDENQVRYNINK